MRNLSAGTDRLVGYARASTVATASRRERRKAQHVDNQVARLYDAGCEMVFTDEVSGKDASLGQVPGLPAARRHAQLYQAGSHRPQPAQPRRGGGRPVRPRRQHAEPRPGRHRYDHAARSPAVRDHGRGGAVRGGHQPGAHRRGLEAARERHGGKLPSRGRAKDITAEKLHNAARLLRSGVPAAEAARTVGISRSTLYRYVVPEVTRRRWPYEYRPPSAVRLLENVGLGRRPGPGRRRAVTGHAADGGLAGHRRPIRPRPGRAAQALTAAQRPSC